MSITASGVRHDFTFDTVFSPDSEQADVFEIAAVPIIKAATEGYNGECANHFRDYSTLYGAYQYFLHLYPLLTFTTVPIQDVFSLLVKLGVGRLIQCLVLQDLNLRLYRSKGTENKPLIFVNDFTCI